MDYVREKTDYPVRFLSRQKIQDVPRDQYILIIDGVEHHIHGVRATVFSNKAEQLRRMDLLAEKVVGN